VDQRRFVHAVTASVLVAAPCDDSVFVRLELQDDGWDGVAAGLAFARAASGRREAYTIRCGPSGAGVDDGRGSTYRPRHAREWRPAALIT